MKKGLIITMCIISAFIFSGTLSSCAVSNNNIASSDVSKQNYDMSGVRFEDKIIPYDGKPHSLEISGTLPEGVVAIYSKNQLTEVGSLKVTAKFIGNDQKYNKIPDMTATLTIVKGDYDLSNITFEDQTYTYDGKPHSLEISGTLERCQME